MRVVMSFVRSLTSWSMSRSPETMIDLELALLGLPRERADEVVRLEARHLVDRDAERGQRLAHDGELVAQVVRRRPARGLVLLEAVGAERAAHVEAAHDVVGLHVLEAAQHDGPEPERGVDQLALAGRQRRLEQGEIGAVDQAVSVEQHDPFHRPSVPADAAGQPLRGTAGSVTEAAARPSQREIEGGQRTRGPT